MTNEPGRYVTVFNFVSGPWMGDWIDDDLSTAKQTAEMLCGANKDGTYPGGTQQHYCILNLDTMEVVERSTNER